MSTKNISLENEVSNIKEKDVEKQENKNETTKLEENEVKTQNEVIKDENNSNTSNKTINDTKYVPNNYVPAENNSKNDVMSNFTIFVILFIIILLILFAGFTLYNMFNTNIINGVSIKGLDVSNLSTKMLWINEFIKREDGIEGTIMLNVDLNTDMPYFNEKV